MPSQAANLTNMRKGGNKLFCHASIYKGRLIVEATISGLAPSPAVLFVTISTGAHTNIFPGFRVDIFTAGGLFKGRTRIRYGNAINANVFPIRETSGGTISLAVGDIVRVYRDVRLSDKLVAALESFPPDGEAYTNQNDAMRPIVGSGGAYAGWTRMLPAVMTDTSATLDPDSSGAMTHLWDADGLSYASGTSASASPTFTGAAGEYCPSHTVTDSTNSKPSTQYVPVILHDAANPPYKVQIEDLPNDEARGGAARVRFLDDVPLASVPDGALILLWKEEWIANVRQSFGARAPGRSHILLVGILRREEGEGDSATGVETLTFEVISPLARLDELMGYGHVLLRNAAPDVWSEVYGLTVWIAMALLYLTYSNGNEAGHDFVKTSTFQNEAYSGLFADQSTPLQQLRSLAESTDGRLIEDRRGRFEVQMRPELVALASRAALPRTLILTAGDIKAWRYTREHWRSFNRIEVHGLIAGATEAENLALFCEWPGPAPGQGNQTTTIERKIISATNSVQAIKQRTGRLGAAQDGVYVAADGALQMALDLELTLRGVYDVFDCYDEVLELQITANKRGIDFSGHLFVFVSSNVSFDGGKAETTVRFRTCTNGAEGTIFVPPTETYIPPTTLPPTQPPVWTPPSYAGLDAAVNVIAAFNDDGYVYLFSNWQETPVVTRYSLTALGMSGTLVMFIVDAFSPAYRGAGTAVNGEIVTSSHRYTINDIFGTPSLTNAHALRYAGEFGRSLQGTRIVSGFYPLESHIYASTAPYATDIDIRAAGIDTNYPDEFGSWVGGIGNGWMGGMFASEHVPGRIITSGFIGTSVVSQLKISNDDGATWADVGAGTFWYLAGDIHIPVQVMDDSVIYHGGGSGSGANGRRLFKTTNGAQVDVSPLNEFTHPSGPANQFSIKSCDIDADELQLIGLRSGYAATPDAWGVWNSHDAGGTWEVVIPYDIAANMPYRGGNIAGNSALARFLWGVNAIAFSTDGGSTIVSKMGNIAASFGTVGTFKNIAGG